MGPAIAFNEDSIITINIPNFPVTGSFSAGGNLTFRYRYEFDLNALQDGIRVGDFMIALTESGNLVSYDLKRMAVIAVNPKYKATCIGRGKGETILSGFADGRIAIVDPATLQLTPYAQMESRVTWIGSASKGKQEITVAVSQKNYDEPPPVPGLTMQQYMDLESPPPDKIKERDSEPDPIRRYKLDCQAKEQKIRNSLTARILPNGPSFPFSPFSDQQFCNVYPNAYGLDTKYHLWIGLDVGEFGGICAFMDLKTGKVKTIADANVLGFLNCSDGRMLAYGGMVHFGSSSGFIARVDQMKWQTLFQNSKDSWGTDDIPEKNREYKKGPSAPIDHIIEKPADKNYYVLAGQAYYRIDPEFSTWPEGVHTKLLYEGGRSNSVGNTPVYRKLISSQSTDNYWGVLTKGLFFTKPEGGSLYRIPNLLETSYRIRFPGVFDSMLWNQETIFLTREEAKEDDQEDLTYWRANNYVWQRLDKIEAQSIAQQFSFDSVSFRIQHDHIEYLDKQQNWLRVQVHDEPKDKFLEADWISGFIGSSYSFLGIRGNAPIIWDRNRSRLGKIVRNASDETFSFQPIDFSISKNNPGPLWDAYSIEDENILLVSTQGLYRFNTIDGSSAALSLPEPAAKLRSICRDLAGRYWLAGDKLYFSNDRGKNWIPLDFPIIGPTWIKQIRPNPQVRDGIYLLMADRGILFMEFS